MGVTAVIQSSSATTVMVVGFVNSKLMTLRQSIGVIMGANIGTTVTAWILSLGGISGDNFFIRLLKPTSFTPVLALVGTDIPDVFQIRQEKGHGHDPAGLCDADVRYGHDVRRGLRAGRTSPLSAACS